MKQVICITGLQPLFIWSFIQLPSNNKVNFLRFKICHCCHLFCTFYFVEANFSVKTLHKSSCPSMMSAACKLRHFQFITANGIYNHDLFTCHGWWNKFNPIWKVNDFAIAGQLQMNPSCFLFFPCVQSENVPVQRLLLWVSPVLGLFIFNFTIFNL